MRSGRAVFFSSRRRHTRSKRDWSSDVCSSDLEAAVALAHALEDRMSNAQRSPPPIDEAVIDIALRAVDQLRALGHDRSAAAIAAANELRNRLRVQVTEPKAYTPTTAQPADPSTYIHAEQTDPI